MAENLAELRRQRAELDRRIAETEAARIDAWNEALEALDDMMQALGADRGLGVGDSERKNVRTLTIGPVSVELGFIQEDWGAWLAVHRGGLHIVVGHEGEAPSPAVLRALVAALLDEEAGS